MKKIIIINIIMILLLINIVQFASSNINITSSTNRIVSSKYPDSSASSGVQIDDRATDLKRTYMKFTYINGSDLTYAYPYFSRQYSQSTDNIIFYYCYDGIWSGLTWNNQDTLVTDCHVFANVSYNYFTPTYTLVKLNYSIHEYINNDTDKNFTIKMKWDTETYNIGLGSFNADEYIDLSLNMCYPDWTCSGYGYCNSSDERPCNEVTDQNACGGSYTGDYSEFSSQVCDYSSLLKLDFETEGQAELFNHDYSNVFFSQDSSWVSSGSYSLQSNFTNAQTGERLWAYIDNSLTTNENEELNFSINMYSSDAELGYFVFHWNETTNSGYSVGININSNPDYRARVYRIDNGSLVTLNNALSIGSARGKNITITGFMNETGDYIFKFYLNGGLGRTWTGTDTTYTSGKFGFWNWNWDVGSDDLMNFDDIIFYSGGYLLPVLDVEIDSPNDNHITNTKPTMYFTATDEDDVTVDCDLYLNDVLESSNASVNVNESSPFYLDLDEGMNSYYVNCTDGELVGLSDTYDVWYDPNDPFINTASPLPFNTTIFTGYSMNIYGNITNEELEYILVQIYDEDDNLYYENETTSFGDPTIFDYDWDFETNYSQNGVWDMYFYGNDTATNDNELYLSFTVNNCVPDWSCDGYASCNISDLAPCDNVTDLNTCGLSYIGDMSEFSPQACDYCTADWQRDNQECILHTRQITWVDDNEGTCCNVTGLPSDCDDTNPSSEICSLFAYSESDLAPATTDTIVKFILAFAVFIGIAIIGVTATWGYRKVMK